MKVYTMIETAKANGLDLQKYLSFLIEHRLRTSKLWKAVNYAKNHHDTLMNYLLDCRCEISNNRAERKTKSYAIGRKDFMSHTSGDCSGASL